MKHNIIPKALRWMAAAGLCLAAAACSKDDITPEPAPQQGITPTKIIFNVTRGGYDGDAETRAPKSEWKEGDVISLSSPDARGATTYNGKATYTDGEWMVTITEPIISSKLYAQYAENSTLSSTGIFEDIENGDVAYTYSGSYKVDEAGVATITLRLDRHPQGRMTFTGVGKGKELTVLGMKYASLFRCYESLPRYTEAPITLTGEDDGTATLYALPTPSIVTEAGITLTVEYEGKLYTKTFAGKEFKENSNITLAAPSLEGGWAEAVTEYTAADLKMGDYLYSDGTTSDGGLRKLYRDGTVETAPEAVAPEAGKTVIGIVFHAGRHATDSSDYTMPLTAGGPTLAGEVRGYAVALTHANNADYDAANWVKGPNGESGFSVGTSTDEDDWNGYANCRAIHDYVTAHAGEGWEMRHFQAAWACETYGNRSLDYDGTPTSAYEWQAPLKAPAGTSGWFLPSCGQLWYMMPYQDYLNSRFMAAKEVSAAELQEYVKEFHFQSYWSSTKDDYYSAKAMSVHFKDRDRYGVSRNNKYLVSRPVIVF
ncbi:MAG TPA: hypothetical protein H9859_05895 [Candidatus Barnesiella excrementigallinarum]|nr:hypothetical protein [Candidatus Barnesiella excrementigallinarum]